MGTPTRCCSTTSVNSPAIGCGDSRAMMPRHSGSGRPDLTPRTITSMALANSSMNLCCRRFVSRATIQRGRPNVPTNAPSSGTMNGRFGADSQMTQPTRTPPSHARDPERARRDIEPRALQAQAHGDLLARLLALLQLLQRLGDLPAPVLDGVRLRPDGDARGLALRHALDALVGAPLAGEVGVHQQIDDGADRHRRQQEEAHQQEIVAIHASHPSDCRSCRAPRRSTAPAPGGCVSP